MAAFGRSLCAFSPLWAHWYLASTTMRPAALQPAAFDANGPHSGAADVAAPAAGTDLRGIAWWTGAASDANGASPRSMTCAGSRADLFDVSWAEHPALADLKKAAALVTAAVRVCPTHFAAARAIERRRVDVDLLPRHLDI